MSINYSNHFSKIYLIPRSSSRPSRPVAPVRIPPVSVPPVSSVVKPSMSPLSVVSTRPSTSSAPVLATPPSATSRPCPSALPMRSSTALRSPPTLSPSRRRMRSSVSPRRHRMLSRVPPTQPLRASLACAPCARLQARRLGWHNTWRMSI